MESKRKREGGREREGALRRRGDDGSRRQANEEYSEKGYRQQREGARREGRQRGEDGVAEIDDSGQHVMRL